MESDTDSDGSHISATPPRDPFPSPSKLPNKLTSTITHKPFNPPQKTLEKPSKIPPKSTSKPSNPPQNPFQDNLQHHPSPTPTFISSNSSFSIPIKRPNCPNPELPDFNSIRAGSCSFSKASSFSKFTKNDLNFDSTEKDPILQSGLVSKPESEVHCDGFDKKLLKKPSNLIASGPGGNGSGTSLLPAKRAKLGGSEGNFVKLNINGHGRRFTFKNRNSNYNSLSSKRNSYRRNKRSWKGNNAGQSNDLGDEEGVNLAAREGKKPRSDNELVKNAVLDVRNEASDANLVKLLKLTHGYDSFREGQLEAVKMVLARKSTMLVLPTGAGKSLCYQLPAIVFPGITIVISPLVALMIDQLKQLPSVVNGALLSSSQSFDEMSETLSLLKEGSIKVLFVSPERFLNEEFMSIISSCSLISLVVIDEAHCVSEWSHNFRPSYMRLRASVLRDKLNAECILAMTATATRKTLDAVMHALDIPSTNLVKTAQLRNNLQMSVSLSGDNKMKELIGLIKSPPYSELKSIIIYCKFKYETDKIGKYLCDNNISAMSYNSGMLAKDRNRVQALFCSNKIKVVVATVAFGMGLDKSDVGAVIHFSLPESLEEYVQEIGRAGRDGTVSYCHLLFDDIVYFKLRSLMYSDGVDEYMVNKLLCQIFSSEMRLKDETHSLVIESASRKFDIKEEGIKMREILFGEQIELYKDALVYNGLYEISNAPIKTCQDEWRTGPADLMHQMSFNRLTGIQPLHIGSGPIQPQYQNISQIPRVSNTANRYDMVGIVLFVEEEPRKITTQQGKDYIVRELAIVDHSTEQPLLISAWNDLAHTECDLLASKATRLQIIGFTTLKISSHKGFSMTTTMSTTFIHSPTGDKPTNLEHWRNRNQTKLTEMQERILTVCRSFPNKHKSTIATLHKKKAYNTIQDEKYILKVTIPEPSLDKVNAYLGCSKCGKGTDTQAEDVYSCTNCSSDNVISSPRVTFNCQVTDGTGNLPITAFTTNAEKILRMQALGIFRMKHTEDNATFESIKNLL